MNIGLVGWRKARGSRCATTVSSDGARSPAHDVSEFLPASSCGVRTFLSVRSVGFLVLPFLCTVISLKAGDGSLDVSFAPVSFGVGPCCSGLPWIHAVVVQPNGKAVVGGNFGSVNGISRNYVARLNTDGSTDTSFNLGSGANSWVFSEALQPDGKVLIGGVFTSVDGLSRNSIARLNSDGSVDTTFNPGSGAPGAAWRDRKSTRLNSTHLGISYA